MPRLNRFTPAGVPLHVTQRGNFRQRTFADDHDYRFFLDLLDRYCAENGTQILGYCVMPNHFHLALLPDRDDRVSALMQGLTSSYARATNQRMERTGHLWQARYYSVAMDSAHLCKTLAYIDLNPVRAGLVKHPADFPWSSARAHLGVQPYPDFLASQEFKKLYTPTEWHEVLAIGLAREDINELRRATRRGEVAGSLEFIQCLEQRYGKTLGRRAPGRPRIKKPADQAVTAATA